MTSSFTLYDGVKVKVVLLKKKRKKLLKVPGDRECLCLEQWIFYLYAKTLNLFLSYSFSFTVASFQAPGTTTVVVVGTHESKTS